MKVRDFPLTRVKVPVTLSDDLLEVTKMTRNPVERHMRGLRLNANQVAWKTGVSHALISQLYHAKAPLTPNVANGLVGSSRLGVLSLLIGNALWRRDQHVKLTASESAFIEVGETVTGYSADQLSMVTNSGLYYLDSLLTSIPKPPKILLAKGGK